MASSLPQVADKKDIQIGWVATAIMIIGLFVILFMLTFQIADPAPIDYVMQADTVMPEELDLKNLKVDMGNAGSGSPTNDPLDQPKPQQEEVLTTSKTSTTKTNTGKSNKTNSKTNSNNTASTSTQSNNPFGTGGNNGTQGAGNSPFGNDVGNGGDGPAGPGSGEGRKRLNDPSIDHIATDVDITINLKVTVNSEGIVVSALSTSKTTTTDQRIINQVIAAVKNQVKYSKAPGSGLVTQYITVKINAR
ncbi:MAG: hypothetical protein K9G40_11290 [Crocinitomicaceae bacterium]|nr:hypothetical protein [Crocinitomicaceae bacterium]MCF8435074.1 hypothetical protein [Crocinitomicaceae bacterium]